MPLYGQINGYKPVKDSVDMEWDLVKGKYANEKVLYVKDIVVTGSHYGEAVNIVIENNNEVQPTPSPTTQEDIDSIGLMKDTIKRVKGSKDYEILSYEFDGRIQIPNVFIKDGSGLYNPMCESHGVKREGYDLYFLLKQPTSEINSVRRLPDGVVFSVGDKICWGIHLSYETTLLAFEIQDGRLKFNDSERPEHCKWADFLNSANLHKKLPPQSTDAVTDNSDVACISLTDLKNNLPAMYMAYQSDLEKIANQKLKNQ